MVNKERLLELLGYEFYIRDADKAVCHTSDSSMCLWKFEELEEINSIPQLLGRCIDDVNVELYDEIFSKLDDSIFEVDIKKVKANLNKLGLHGEIIKQDYLLKDIQYIIGKVNFPFIERMKLIPEKNRNTIGEKLYNNVLKASKEWNNGRKK